MGQSVKTALAYFYGHLFVMAFFSFQVGEHTTKLRGWVDPQVSEARTNSSCEGPSPTCSQIGIRLRIESPVVHKFRGR
jgi:hypothetical protein